MYMTDNDVESLWDYQEAQEAFGKYFSDSADADIRRVRLRADRPNEGVAFVMIGASESLKILTTKTIAFNRRNRKRGLSFGDGALVCMEWPGGQLRAVIAARSFTALRTATCSALATSHLASSGPHRALFIGAGSQARAHLGALITVSELEAITVCGRSHQGVQGFLDYAQRLVPGRARAGSPRPRGGLRRNPDRGRHIEQSTRREG